MGKFIRVDKYYLHGMNKIVAKVMVGLDIAKGLPVEIDMIWGTRVFC